MGLRPQRRPSAKKGEGDSISSGAQTTSASSQGNQNNEGNQNNNDSGSSPPTTREAWTARGQLLLNFHHAISRAINSPEMIRKCNQIAEVMSRSNNEESNAQQLSHPTVAEEYSAEAALIVENKSKRDADVRNKSLAVGLFSFVALRSGRGLSSWMRKAIANRRYQFDKVPATGSANHLMQKNAESAGALKQPSKLRRFLRLAIDATISTSITLLSGAYIFMPQPTAYIEDMSKLPLVEGKSAYAEIVCPPLLQEYRRTLMQYGSWPIRGAGSDFDSSDNEEQEGDTQEDVSLNIIRKFVENCTKRSKYEVSLNVSCLWIPYSMHSNNPFLTKSTRLHYARSETPSSTLITLLQSLG